MNFDIRYVSNLDNSMLFKMNTNSYGNGTSITENNLIKCSLRSKRFHASLSRTKGRE